LREDECKALVAGVFKVKRSTPAEVVSEPDAASSSSSSSSSAAEPPASVEKAGAYIRPLLSST
jgi:hypothetical protein